MPLFLASARGAREAEDGLIPKNGFCHSRRRAKRHSAPPKRVYFSRSTYGRLMRRRRRPRPRSARSFRRDDSRKVYLGVSRRDTTTSPNTTRSPAEARPHASFTASRGTALRRRRTRRSGKSARGLIYWRAAAHCTYHGRAPRWPQATFSYRRLAAAERATP